MKIERGTKFQADGKTWTVTRHVNKQVTAEIRDAAGRRIDWRVFPESVVRA